jgi:hypothetical protein
LLLLNFTVAMNWPARSLRLSGLPADFSPKGFYFRSNFPFQKGSKLNGHRSITQSC